MSLDIHEGARVRLVEALTRGLAEVRVEGNSFLDYRSLSAVSEANAVLPGEHSVLGKRIAAYTSSEPVSDFVAGEIGEELRTREFSGSTQVAPLTSIPDYTDTGAVAERLTRAFMTLPWEYELFAAVPHEVAKLLGAAFSADEYAFGGQVGLVRGEAIIDSHPAGSERSGLLDTSVPVGPKEGALYLRIRTSGYVPPYGGTTPVEDAHLTVRAFFGFCVAFRLARFGAYSWLGPQKRQVLVYRAESSGWRYQRAQEMSADSAHAVAGLGVNKMLSEFDDSERVRYARSQLAQLRSVFQRSEQSGNIRSAAQWLFDSLATSNRLLSFVQATVALETLLGDKAASDQTGLGELLANRAAYLIAKDRQQRDEVLTDFRRIYDTRSKIVHRGKNRLSTGELNDLQTLEWICSRVIQEEVRLLSAIAE